MSIQSLKWEQGSQESRLDVSQLSSRVGRLPKAQQTAGGQTLETAHVQFPLATHRPSRSFTFQRVIFTMAHTEAASVYPPLQDRPLKNTICLFDVDNTLTPARLVSLAAAALLHIPRTRELSN